MTAEPPTWDSLLMDYEELLLGSARVRHRESDHVGDALIVARAHNVGEFERHARTAFLEDGYELLGLEGVTRLGDFVDVTVELLPLAAEAIETHGVAVGALSVPAPDDETESVQPAPLAGEQLRASQSIVGIAATNDEHYGALVAHTDEFALFQLVDLTSMSFGGYALYPQTEILDLDRSAGVFLEEALEGLGASATPLDAPLTDLPAFVSWARDEGLLVGVVCGPTAPGRRFVGAISRVGPASFHARGIAYGSEWDVEESEWPYAEITRIDVLDGYLTAAKRALQRRGWRP